MRRTRAVFFLVALASSGCASMYAPMPGGAESGRPFADVPPPPRCKLAWSYVYESEAFRYGTMIFKGRAGAEEVVDWYRQEMPRENWRYEETLRSGETIVRYTKTNGRVEHCDITIGKSSWLGTRYVVVNLTGSRTK